MICSIPTALGPVPLLFIVKSVAAYDYLHFDKAPYGNYRMSQRSHVGEALTDHQLRPLDLALDQLTRSFGWHVIFCVLISCPSLVCTRTYVEAQPGRERAITSAGCLVMYFSLSQTH